MAEQAKATGGDTSEMMKKVRKDEARLMQRDIEELKTLLGFMEVEFNQKIDDKARLVALIIAQKHTNVAAAAVQKVQRSSSGSSARILQKTLSKKMGAVNLD